MGIVYAAQDSELRRRVALKVLPRAAMADEERRRRFVREARTAAAVSHPHLASVYDVGETDDTVFIAMELVHGASLATRITEAPFPIAEVLRIGLGIARGLGAAHRAGVVHRDLKPANVMLDAEGAAKIVDFGLAKLVLPASGADPRAADLPTQEGKILGTPSYMAPEQARGERVGPSADVFSLGVVLYEMLAGRRPFTGATMMDVLVSVARDAPPPLSRRIPREIERVVFRCLAKDPAARPADGDVVAAALEAASRSAPRRRQLAFVVGLGGAATLLVLGMAAARHAPAEATPASEALPPASIAPPVLVSTELPADETPPPSTSVAPAVVSSVTRPVVPRPSTSITQRIAPRPSIDPLAHQK
jgi:serine/threonine-protein kinase